MGIDTYGDLYGNGGDIYGADPGPPGGGGGGGSPGPPPGFNGIRWPRWIVKAGIGAGGALVDITTDTTGRPCVITFTRGFGRNTPIDSADPGTATVVFNNRSGDYDPTNTSGAYKAMTVGTAIVIQAEFPVGTFKNRFTGTITDLVINLDPGPLPTVTINAADGLEQLGRAELAAGISTFASVTTGGRIASLADLAAWSSTARAIDATVVRLWKTMELGTTVLELMRKVELTEMGLLFVDEYGVLTFWDRYHAGTASRSISTQLPLADTSASNAARMVDLTMQRSRDGVYNDIHLTREPDPAQASDLTGSEPADEPQERSASDATSISVHGHLNLPADLGKLHDSDNAVGDQANMLLGLYKNVADRVDQVTVNCLHPKVTTNSLSDELLALTLLDRISVSRNYGPSTLSKTLLVQRIEEEVVASPPAWTLTLTTTDAPPPPTRFILGTSVLGTDPIGY